MGQGVPDAVLKFRSVLPFKGQRLTFPWCRHSVRGLEDRQWVPAALLQVSFCLVLALRPGAAPYCLSTPLKNIDAAATGPTSQAVVRTGDCQALRTGLTHRCYSITVKISKRTNQERRLKSEKRMPRAP